MNVPKTPPIPEIPSNATGTALVAILNDRLRKISLLSTQAPQTGGVVTGTHAQRLAALPSKYPDTMWLESDRQNIAYYSDGTAWHFVDGIMSGPLASMPGGPSQHDAGLLYLATDTLQIFRWDGSKMVCIVGALVSAGGKIGYGLNLTWNSTTNLWVSGTNPNSGCGAILVDAVTGVMTLYAVPAPSGPVTQQTFTPTQLETHKMLQLDPRAVAGNPVAHVIMAIPFLASAFQLLLPGTDIAHTETAVFDLSLLSAGSAFTYQLPNITDATASTPLAGAAVWAGGTGQVAVKGAAGANNWQKGALLIGVGADIAALLAPAADGRILTTDSTANPTGILSWDTPTGAAAGTYGDATHWASVVVSAAHRITSITAIATNGITHTVPLAKLTTGGANGSLTFTNGILTAATDPT